MVLFSTVADQMKIMSATENGLFCAGRHAGRTSCDLSHLPLEQVEDAGAAPWDRAGLIHPGAAGATGRSAAGAAESSLSRLSSDQDSHEATLDAVLDLVDSCGRALPGERCQGPAGLQPRLL